MVEHAFVRQRALFVDRPELFFFQQLGSQMSEGYFLGFWKMITLMGTNISPYRLALWVSSEGSFPTKQNCVPKKFEVASLILRHSIRNFAEFRLQWLGNLCHHPSSFLGALLNDLGSNLLWCRKKTFRWYELSTEKTNWQIPLVPKHCHHPLHPEPLFILQRRCTRKIFWLHSVYLFFGAETTRLKKWKLWWRRHVCCAEPLLGEMQVEQTCQAKEVLVNTGPQLVASYLWCTLMIRIEWTLDFTTVLILGVMRTCIFSNLGGCIL